MVNLNVLTRATKYGNIFGIESYFNSFVDIYDEVEKRDLNFLKRFIKENNLKLKFICFVTTQHGIVKTYDILNYESIKYVRFFEKEVAEDELNSCISFEHIRFPSIKNNKIVEAWYGEIGEKDLIKIDSTDTYGIDDYVRCLEQGINEYTDADFLKFEKKL